MNIESTAVKLSDMASSYWKNDLNLLGLFLREDSGELWDLVIASPSLKSSELASFEKVAKGIRLHLNQEELASLSRIVILDQGGAVLNAFIKEFANRLGLLDIHFVLEGGAVIRRAYAIIVRGVTESPKTVLKKPLTLVARKSRTPKTSSRNQ